SLQSPRALDGLQAPFQMTDALANAPAVHLELGFARAARADSAPQSGEMGPLARQARQQIFELGELDLQFAFVAAGALRKDIEDELAAVDDPRFERRFQIALLRGR